MGERRIGIFTLFKKGADVVVVTSSEREMVKIEAYFKNVPNLPFQAERVDGKDYPLLACRPKFSWRIRYEKKLTPKSGAIEGRLLSMMEKRERKIEIFLETWNWGVEVVLMGGNVTEKIPFFRDFSAPKHLITVF
jgi:hypothetical protein